MDGMYQAAPKAAPTWPSEALVWEALQAYLKHDTNMEGMRAALIVGATTQQVAQEHDPLAGFQEGQRWIKELDALASHPIGACIHVTADLKRSLAVVHNLLRLARKQEAQEPCPSCKNSDIYACTCTFQTSRNAAPNPSPLSNDVFQKTWRLLDELEKLRSANRDEEDWGTLNKRDNELRAAMAAEGGE